MYFTDIRLKNFRNYIDQTICFHPKVNIIRGNNAQGKTNILEGLYIMSLGKSFRTNKDSEMIGFNADYCSVKSTYIKDETERNIEIILSKIGKSLIIDGYKAKKSSELIDNVYIVAFTPEDMKIVKDEPERRRRFMDRELCQLKPVYYSNLQKYKKALIQRNALLKQGDYDEGLMEVWENNLVEYGSKIIIERAEFIDKIKDISKTIHEKITEGREELKLSYDASISGDKEVKYEFQRIIRNERKRDTYRGSTGSGPHRDDIIITIDDMDVRNFGSQGQQRTAALSLKLAEVLLIKEDKKVSPVLLLDDVLSELDEKRQEFLLKSFSDVQLFITTAEMKETLWSNLPDRRIFNVNEGQCWQV